MSTYLLVYVSAGRSAASECTGAGAAADRRGKSGGEPGTDVYRMAAMGLILSACMYVCLYVCLPVCMSTTNHKL